MESNVAFRHHIRTEQSHQQIDVAGPFSDSLQPDKVLFHLGVGEQMQAIKIQSPVEQGFGKVASVRSLLPTESDRLQLRVTQRQYRLRSHISETRRELIKTRLRRCQRDLLFEYDLQQRREPRLAIPQGRNSILHMNNAEMWII